MTRFEKLNWTTILSILVAIELQVGSGQMSLTHMFPDAWIPFIQAWSSNLGTIGATIMAVLSYGNKRVPGDSIAIKSISGSLDQISHGDHVEVATGGASSVAKVVGLLLFAFILAALVLPSPGYAQQPLKLTGNPVRDFAPKPATPSAGVDGAVSSFSDNVQKIEKALVDKGIADLTAAITDATNHQDNISLPCWQANLKLLQSLPSQWETPPSPIGIALGIQIQRDILNSITGNDAASLKVACAALWGDQLKIVANVGALIGIRIATGGLF